jgi:hypothetical protein
MYEKMYLTLQVIMYILGHLVLFTCHLKTEILYYRMTLRKREGTVT